MPARMACSRLGSRPRLIHPSGRGDGTDDFSCPVHRKVVVEHGSPGRLAVGFDHVLQLLVHLDLHEVTARRGRVNLDDGEAADGLKSSIPAGR